MEHAPGCQGSEPDCRSQDAVEPEEEAAETLAPIREMDGLPRVAAFLHSQEEELGDLDDFVLFTEDHFRDEDGLVCVSQKSGGRVVVPESLRHAVLDYVHRAVSTGHFGVAKTYSRAAERFWWPTMAKDVQRKVKLCVQCDLSRAFPPKTQGILGVYHPSRRFEIVSVDVLEISPTTDRGNKKVVVIGDAFTRFMWAFPVSEESMAIIARVLLDQLILRFGVPEKLLSDRGTSFTGNLIQSICTLTGMKKIFTTAYHPQTNGMVERFNKTLCRDLSAYVTLEVDWDLYVSLACFRYNTSVNAATKVSPYKSVFAVRAFDFDNEI